MLVCQGWEGRNRLSQGGLSPGSWHLEFCTHQLDLVLVQHSMGGKAQKCCLWGIQCTSQEITLQMLENEDKVRGGTVQRKS